MKSTAFDISSRVTIHDIHQLEIKLEYKLEEFEHRNNYKVDMFIFVPSSLDINPAAYPKKEFYKDFHNYIRFKTPSYSFKLILDPEFTRSPFYGLKEVLEVLKEEKDVEKKSACVRQAIKELKLLGCMVRARLRDFKMFFDRKLRDPNRDVNYIVKRLQDPLRRGIAILGQLRGMKKKYLNYFPEQEELFKYFQLVEEFLSNTYEEEMIRIFRNVTKEIPHNEKLNSLEEFFHNFLKDELKYRSENEYKLIFRKDEKSKEAYIYYMGQCKKTVSSVLYLDLVREEKDLTQVHLIGSVAAFTASVISYFLSRLIAKQFAFDSAVLVIMLSLAYVFKDRIKDLLKMIFRHRFDRFLPDHNNEIVEMMNDEKLMLGRIRESASFITEQDLDPSVQRLRETTADTFLPEGGMEKIILYRKIIDINTKQVQKQHSRTVNFTDIMRLNFRRYFVKMDDPIQEIDYFDEDLEHGFDTTGVRSYHVNICLKYSRFEGKKEYNKYERYRIVMNKDGIMRIEFIDEK